MNDEEYVRGIEEQRAATRAALHGPTSSLAAVARHELPVGSRLVFGPGAGADVRLEGADRDIDVRALADAFVVDGERADSALVEAGRYVLRLSHQNYPAIVVLDRESPRLREQIERRWYPVDRRLRIGASFEFDGARTAIASTASAQRPADRVGWVRFTLDGVGCRLAALRLLEPGVSEDHLDVYFRDATTGHGSYAVGRYARVERAGDDALVDFNLAYNPACALSPYYNCPIPPPENVLLVAVRAGEMTPVTGSAAAHGWHSRS